MKRALLPAAHALVLLCVVSLLPVRALAWGKTGHRIVARVAWARLSGTPALEEVKALLGDRQTDFLAASTWPDEVRRRRPYTYADNWHFVSIPRSRDRLNLNEHCRETVNAPAARGSSRVAVNDCVVGALDYLKAVLGDPNATTERRADALKFVVHFVGDMHQPLHCSEDKRFRNHKNTTGERYGDRGGNYKFVCFFDRCFEPRYRYPSNNNLHSTWDSGMIAHKQLLHKNATGRTLSEQAYADSLLSDLDALFEGGELNAIAEGTPAEWAEEAHAEAKNFAYSEENYPRELRANPHANNERFRYRMLGTEYYEANIRRVDRQLARAGVRLAALLREVFES